MELTEREKRARAAYAKKRSAEKLAMKEKTYKGEWYTVNSLFGNDWARFFYLLGGREAGKSYSVMKWVAKRKLENPKGVKFYWFRLTEAATAKLLRGKATDLIDPDIRRKYDIKTFTNGNAVYTYDEEERVKKTGKVEKKKTNIQEFCRIMACSTFYNDKGVGYFDNEYKGEYIVVLDEMNREANEKNTFDIVYAFANQIENVLRSIKNKVKVIMIGNTLEEASDLLASLNFIPDKFGRYKLKRKLAVVDYIKPNEEYLKRREGATANILSGQSSTFTNEIQPDRSLLINTRLKEQPMSVIKFNKTPDTWFTMWNGNIIDRYNNENKPVIAMQRYLDEIFNINLQKSVIEMFDTRAFRFVSLSCFKLFQKQLQLLKKT